MGQDVERLLQAIPIDSYIQRVVTLKKRGSNYIGLCPFHSEKTPSFTVSPDRGIFKCFGCGKGGNVISFVQEYEKVSFREALEILARYAGIELEKNPKYTKKKTDEKKEQQVYKVLEWVATLYENNRQTPAVSRYLQERKVQSKSIEHFRIGYAPDNYHFLEQNVQNTFQDAEKIQAVYAILLELGLLGRRDEGGYFNRFRDRLMFPIFNNENQVIAFGGRQLTKNEKTAKYINSSDSAFFNKKNILFHFSSAIEEARKNKSMIIVEGYFDVLGLYQQGIENVVASMGTAFTPEHARLVKRYCEQCILFFDSDHAGMEAALKSFLVCKAAGLSVRVVTSHGDKKEKADPFDLATQLDTFSLYAIIDQAKNELDFILWYIFSHKYNILDIQQKRMAIENFFEVVASFNEEWEKEEYLKAAAQRLQVSNEALKKDFYKGKVAETIRVQLQRQQERQRPSVSVALPLLNSEKDFIAILLRFPDFWTQEKLLEQMHWQSNDLYLLYSFFRDRARVGEIFSANNADETASIVTKLPQELALIFSEIVLLIDMGNTVEENEKNVSSTKEDQETQETQENKEKYFKILKSIVWRSCHNYYKTKSQNLKRQLEEKEKQTAFFSEEINEQDSIASNNTEIEMLFEEWQITINEQKKYLDLLEKD